MRRFDPRSPERKRRRANTVAAQKGSIDTSAIVRLSLGTRLDDDAIYSETQDFSPRFGTEGSEVQILSPRPIFLIKTLEFSLVDHSVSPEWSVPQIALQQVSQPQNDCYGGKSLGCC